MYSQYGIGCNEHNTYKYSTVLNNFEMVVQHAPFRPSRAAGSWGCTGSRLRRRPIRLHSLARRHSPRALHHNTSSVTKQQEHTCTSSLAQHPLTDVGSRLFALHVVPRCRTLFAQDLTQLVHVSFEVRDFLLPLRVPTTICLI